MKRSRPSASENNDKNVSCRRRVSDVTGDEVQFLLHTLSNIQQQLQLRLGTLPLLDLSPKRIGGKPRKHIAQHTSLIGHLKRFNLTKNKSMFIEFGSGVGRFSEQLQEETDAMHFHLLIDRETFKPTRLRDTTMRRRATSNKHVPPDAVQRVTADINDLNLVELIETAYANVSNDIEQDTTCSSSTCKETNTPSTNKQNTMPIVAVSKHLCGEGFDMALSRLFEYHEAMSIRPTICMTPCCHCLCTWEKFVNRSFFKVFGIGEKEFEAMSAVSQWASLRFQEDVMLGEMEGVGKSTVGKDGKEGKDRKDGDGTDGTDGTDGDGNARVLTANTLKLLSSCTKIDKAVDQVDTMLILERQQMLLAMSGKELESELTRREKRQLGRCCKECIDVARACGVLENGYSQVVMFRYTQHSTENLLMVSI